MQEAYMHPHVTYVEVTAQFTPEGDLLPKTLVHEKRYVIEKVLSVRLLSDEETQAIFPPPPRQSYTIFQYEVLLKEEGSTHRGARARLCFDLWPLGDPESVGRWFVVKRQEEE